MPHAQDRLLGQLTCSPMHYNCTMAAPEHLGGKRAPKLGHFVLEKELNRNEMAARLLHVSGAIFKSYWRAVKGAREKNRMTLVSSLIANQ